MKSFPGQIYLLIGIMLICLPATSFAQHKFGVRIGSYTELDELYIGADFVSPLGTRTWFNPNLEYVLLEHGTFLTANADIHYDLLTGQSALAWLGGGAGLAYFNPEGDGDNSTDLALNLLGGIGLKAKNGLIPYVQLKFILGNADDVVLTLGLRF